MPACGSPYSRKFVLFTRISTAACTRGTGGGAAWRARETIADSSTNDEAYTAASLPGRCAVHAGHDYASRASG